MARDRKKEEELRAFRSAREQIPEWQGGDALPGEEPDFVLQGGALGVEVTAIVDGKRRAEIKAKTIALGMAQERYEIASGVRGLQVTVIYAPDLRMTKDDQGPACAELLGIVGANFAADAGETVQKKLRRFDDFESRFFSMVYLHFLPAYTSAHWQPAEAHWVPVLTAEDIQQTIDLKESKLARYRARVPSCWLLIVANGFDGSTAANFAEEALEATYRSSFDGLVLFDDVMQSARRLRVSPPS